MTKVLDCSKDISQKDSSGVLDLQRILNTVAAIVCLLKLLLNHEFAGRKKRKQI